LKQTKWFPSFNIGSSFLSIAGWLADKIGRKSPEHVVAPPVTAYLSPLPPFLDAPSNLVVTTASSSSIGLSWTAPAGSVDHYQVERSLHVNGPFLLQGTSTGSTYTDNNVSNGNAYLYRVRAIGSGGIFSTPSNMALGTAVSFEFSSLQGQLIKAQHIYDIRTAVNAVRSVANLTAASWTLGTLGGVLVQASVVQELRNKLDEALVVLSINAGAYQDPTLAIGANGTLIKAIHLEQLQTRSTGGSSSSSGPIDSDSSTARLDPLNGTGGGGENPLSRNFNWNLPLVSLPGRAGLDLGLSLSYNSLVWTKSGSSTISFDDDRGFPGPGFRLGFPTIQTPYFNSETGKNAYLLIGSDGGHTELRQVATNSVFYESADSSHLLLDVTQLTDPNNPRMLLLSNGTQLTFKFMSLAYECTEIKDRNGNYLTINYNTSGAASGRISNIHDTLDRTVTFNYDSNGWLTSITQQWKRQPPNQAEVITHTWATFDYINRTIDTNFSDPNFGALTVVGPADNSTIKVLSKVTLDDNSTTPAQNSHFDFSYTSWGQVWKISSFAADNHLLNYRAYNLALDGSMAYPDCPRFTERRDWGQWANGDTDGTPATSEETLTSYIIPVSHSWTMMPDNTQHSGLRCQITSPDGTFEKIYFADTVAGIAKGWLRGLPEVVESYDVNGTVAQRQVFTSWEQDNETISYELNPRVKETNIYDPSGNRKLTSITYQQFTPPSGSSYKLPRDVFEYAADAATVLRSTRTDYVDGDDEIKTPYLSRRILGLPKEKTLYEGDVTNGGTLQSRVAFNYDGTGSIQGTDAPVQHSASSVSGRGNLSSIQRFEVTTNGQSTGQSTTSSLQYNTAGAVVSLKDPLLHEVKISYADVFTNGELPSPATLAYPTKVTDPDGYWSSSIYNFDFGAVTKTETPPPNVTGTPNPQPPGPQRTYTFDDLGRLERTTSLVNNVNNAYTRFEYGSNGIRSDTYATIQEGLGEAHSFKITDGVGRVIASASDHPATPGTVARFDAQRIEYDVMGRVVKTSNPAETSAIGDNPSQWQLVEGDAGSSWMYTLQTYDWKGRPLVTTNPSLTSNPAETTTKEISYAGCGCAGGEVVTLTDEGTLVNGTNKARQQKIYADVLGRTVKTEIWDFEGTGPGGNGRALYSTKVTTYNARDQVEQIRRFDGPEGSSTFQDTTMTYDGYGRLATRHLPEQQDDPNNPNDFDHTTWTYNPDDTMATVKDARGAVTTYGYNARHLVTSADSVLSGSPTINVTYGYDSAGNRKTMSHLVGGIAHDDSSYSYDELSRLTSETIHINALQSYSPNYGYYTIGYGYTLSNQLASVVDPFNSPTDISYDEIGRTKTVTGTWNGTNYTYADNVSYRAWGAVKSVSSGPTISYNSRMLPTHYGSYDYTYYDDGRLQEFRDLNDQIGDPHYVQFHYMSRRYSYDQKGRVSSVGQLQNYSILPPFSGSYGYDAFDNLTSRSGQYALNSTQSDSASYTNNRRAGWTYNAEGQVTNSTDNSDSGGSSTRAWTYDAAGTLIFTSEVRNGQTTTTALGFDGDGQLISEIFNGSTSDYLIRSSVLGRVLTKLKSNGGKDITYVPVPAAIGLVAPMQMQDQPYSSPASYLTSVSRDPLGIQENGSGYDPFGALVANVQPPVSGGPPGYTPVYGPPYGWGSNSLTNANNFSGGCRLDGRPADCNTVRQAIENGAAGQCPNNDCGPRMVHDSQGNPHLAPLDWNPQTGKLDYWYQATQIGGVKSRVNGEDWGPETRTTYRDWAKVSFFGMGGFFLGIADPQNSTSPRTLMPAIDHKELRDDFSNFLSNMSQDCKDALKGFMKDLKALAYGASLYDVNKIGNAPASAYLGARRSGTLGQFFDGYGHHAFAATDVPRSGLYFRSTSTFSGEAGMYLLLHEMTHLAYPSGGVNHDLDETLAQRLGLTRRTGESWSTAVSRFFNSKCTKKGP
jgi:YD repeat-containing protein